MKRKRDDDAKARFATSHRTICSPLAPLAFCTAFPRLSEACWLRSSPDDHAHISLALKFRRRLCISLPARLVPLSLLSISLAATRTCLLGTRSPIPVV